MGRLEVSHLTKNYDNYRAVDDVSFHVDDDEFFVLLGPSDSGKTTILRLICGFEEADKGLIFLNNMDITNREAQSRNMAVVLQEQSLLLNNTVFDNLAQSLRFRRVPKDEIVHRVQIVADMLGLTDRLYLPAKKLSGGEIQRVAIGRAIVKDAQVYMFDEPISQLDPTTRLHIRQEMVMVHQIKNRPTIYLTQDFTEAFSIADRIGILNAGKLQQVGTVDELTKHPANVFVAQFLSDPPMNLIEAAIQYSENRYRLYMDGLAFMFPSAWNRSLSRLGPQSRILLGIRPSQIIPEWSFSTLGHAPHLILAALITRVGPLMGKRLVHFIVGDRTELIAEFKDAPPDFHLHVGQMLKLAFNPEQLLLFHPQTHACIFADVTSALA